jgi:hypothetical protein
LAQGVEEMKHLTWFSHLFGRSPIPWFKSSTSEMWTAGF